jgi:serine/threonine protein kinase
MAKDGAPKSLPMPFHTIRRYQYSSFMTLKDVEDVEFYRPGGYHPVDIGDTIANGNDAYTVLHKLGHGGSSTHWLVKLQRPELSEAHLSFHALKIFSADALGDERADQEMKVLQRLGQVGRASHPSIPVLEDSFNICGPNGQHRCLVLPFFGPSVKRARFAHTLTPAQRHHICQQLASAVTFLHSHGICHGGKAL